MILIADNRGYNKHVLRLLLLGTAATEGAGQVVVGTPVKAGGAIAEQAIDQFVVALPAPAGVMVYAP